MYNLNDYQKQAETTAIYPNIGNNVVYPILGLAGEAGEVAGKFSKVIRDNNGIVTEEMRIQLIKELGDVLWFTAVACSELKITMNEVAEKNIEKLFSRKERGVISGSGDNR